MKLKKNLYIFCIWVWILSVYYILNLTYFSTFYLTLGSFIFSVIRQIIYKYPNISYIIILFEFFIFFIVSYKHFKIDKKPLIDFSNAFFSLLLFLLYLIFLKITINKTFYEYYFKVL